MRREENATAGPKVRGVAWKVRGLRQEQAERRRTAKKAGPIVIRYNHLKGAEILHRPKGLQKYSLRSTVPFAPATCHSCLIHEVALMQVIPGFAAAGASWWGCRQRAETAACGQRHRCSAHQVRRQESIYPSVPSTCLGSASAYRLASGPVLAECRISVAQVAGVRFKKPSQLPLTYHGTLAIASFRAIPISQREELVRRKRSRSWRPE